MGCESEGFEGKQWNYNNPLNWFLTPNFIFASESRAISDYASWFLLVNNALAYV